MVKKTFIYIFILIFSFLLIGCDSFNSINQETESTITNTNLTFETFTTDDSGTTTIDTNIIYEVSFDTLGGNSIDPIYVRNGESIALPNAERDGYTFLGWMIDKTPESELVNDPFQPNSDITLYAKWEALDWSDVENYLDDLIPSELSSNINLPSEYNDYSISWESDNQEVLSDSGIYNRPYQPTVISLTAIIKLGENTLTKIYNVEALGYKSLSAPLVSSYIYRDYKLVTDSFFETVDIINCAFITADSSGELSGVAVLANISTYIMPKAHENGNWVLFSIGPGSEWSNIASTTSRMNNFADNIVEMINTYGFDGVDIDWETPNYDEATRFTEMMSIIYTKVKANNPNHLVTAAIAGGMWQPPRYDLTNSSQYLDYINMMTYGMVNNGGYYQNALSRSTTYDNPENLAGRTVSSCSIKESVEIYNSYGVPNSKIIVGVAFYGIKQTRTYDSSTNTWSSWVKEESVSYSYIVNNYLNNDNYNYYYDRNAGVPYIISTDGTVFISYDNPRSILEKSEYIIEEGLGGMMYWENGLDLTGSLLLAMDTGLND